MKRILLFTTLTLSVLLASNASSFISVGKGVIDAGDEVYRFDLSECRLQPQELQSGWTSEYNVVGAGKIDGKDFFVHLTQSSRGKKKSITAKITFMPLPPVYPVPITEENVKVINAMDNAKKATLYLRYRTPFELLVTDTTIKSKKPVKLTHMINNFMLDKTKEQLDATIDITCK